MRALSCFRGALEIKVVATACLAAAWIVGCDSSGLGKIVPVRGQVTYDGQPLKTGSLVFRPVEASGTVSKFEPAGTIQTDGTYSLYTVEKEGAPLGKYQVAVVAEEHNPNDPYAPAKSLIPPRYKDVTTSGLTVEVVESAAPGAYDLKLTK